MFSTVAVEVVVAAVAVVIVVLIVVLIMMICMHFCALNLFIPTNTMITIVVIEVKNSNYNNHSKLNLLNCN